MRTEVLRVDPHRPDAEALRRAADVIRRGGLVAFPTETVYGLGANALDASAVAGIFAAKGRPAHNPIIVHVPDAASARSLVTTWPASASVLADRFWPGALTLVLPKRPEVPAIVTAGGPTAALRVPAHPVALGLLQAAALPIAAPSANLSTTLSPTRAEHVLRGLDGRIDLVLDGGPTSGGLESTVLDLTSTPPRLLRPGLVSPAEIEAVIGPIQRPAAMAEIAEEQALPSPGMLRRHYAPRAPLECAAGDGRTRVEELSRQGVRVGWVRCGQGGEAALPGVLAVALPCEPAAYSAQLYAVLHELDEAGVARIIVALPPMSEEWLAVQDRLRRAATSS
jgi:L-threonylcarbamoyladenylate synthase